MTHENFITDEKLNALLDNELDKEERAEVLNFLRKDSKAALRYAELVHIKDSIITAYESPPLPPRQAKNNQLWSMSPAGIIAASIVLFIVGGIAGWFSSAVLPLNSAEQFYSISQLDHREWRDDKILIHIGTIDPVKVTSALDAAESLLQSGVNSKSDIQVEVVANVEGLAILRKDSVYASRIQNMSSNYSNVSFKACGIAKKVAALREQKDIDLIPQAEDIPAALDQILLRIKQGWVYVKANS